MADAEEPFSLKRVQDIFNKCLSEDKEVYIKHYVEGWQVLVRYVNI